VALIPIPVCHAELRRRGCDQAELIARSHLNGCAQRRCNRHTEVWIRKRDTASQIGLASQRRPEPLRAALGIKISEVVKGREVLLVNDVFTPAATVSECGGRRRSANARGLRAARRCRTAQRRYVGMKSTEHRIRSRHQRVPLLADLTRRSNRASKNSVSGAGSERDNR
jgi:predicted amidophosphoribosyltransferase